MVSCNDVVEWYLSPLSVKEIFRILPREFFADEESWQAFRRLAAAAPSAKPAPRPVRVLLLWIAIIIAVFVVWTLFNRT